MPDLNGAPAIRLLGTEAPQPEPAPVQTAMPTIADLGMLVKDIATNWMSAKRVIEEEMMEAYLDYKGEYSQSTLAAIRARPNRSEVFVKLPMSVCNAAKSLSINLLFEDGGLPWDIEPTMDPEMAMAADSEQQLSAAVMEAANQVPPEQREAFLAEHDFSALLEEERQRAKNKAAAMRRQMKDDIQEMKLDELFMRGLDPFTIYGTMCIQGPFNTPRKPVRWVKTGSSWSAALSRSGKATKEDAQSKNLDLKPTFRLLNNWSVYPDPTASCVEEAEGVLVRHVMSRHAVSALRKQADFIESAIKDTLETFENKGNWAAQWWENTITTGDDANTVNRFDKFEVYELHKWIDGRELANYGISVPDSLLDEFVMAEIWVIDDTVIKAVVSNMEPAELPFHFVPYNTSMGRLWGIGVPRQMSDSTDIYNAAERAKIDNMRSSSGCQYVVDSSRLVDPDQANNIYPDKVWKIDDMTGLGLQPVSFFQPTSNVEHMLAIQNAVRWHVQKETNLPDFAMGIPGSPSHNRTAEGLAMQKDMAMGFIRTVIANIDTFGIKPVIRAIYNWEMNFNHRDEIKGDFEVVPLGVMSAMDDNALVQRIMGIIQSPLAEDWLKLDKAVPVLARKSKVDELDIIRTPEEVEAKRRSEADAKAEADQKSKRFQPEIPQKNAVMDFLGKVDQKSPMYAPALEIAADNLGIMTDKLRAALDAQNEIMANNVANMVTAADLEALKADIDAKSAIMDHTVNEMKAKQDLLNTQAAMPQQPPPAVHLNMPAPPKPSAFKFTKNPDGSIHAERVEGPADPNVNSPSAPAGMPQE